MANRAITGTIYKHSGAVWPNAKLVWTLLTDTATRAGEALPVWSRTIYTESDGTIPAGFTLEVPATGSFLYRLKIESNTALDFYLSAGGGLTIDQVVFLAGQAGSDSGTPQAEWLIDIYAGVLTATDGQVLTADGAGGADWEDIPAIDAIPKVNPATAGNLPLLLADGTLEDAGYAADVLPTAGSVVRRGADNSVQIEDLFVSNMTAEGTVETAGLAVGVDGSIAEISSYFEYVGVAAAANRTAQRREILAADQRPTQTDIAGTTHTFTTANENQIVASQSGSATTFTIPLNSAQAFPVGSIVGIEQQGAGVLTIQATAGVTLNGVDGNSVAISAQWGAATLRKISVDGWSLTDRSAAAVASDLNDHELATGAGVHGAGATGAAVLGAATVDAARAELGLGSQLYPAKSLNHFMYGYTNTLTGSGAGSALASTLQQDLDSGTVANSTVRRQITTNTPEVGWFNFCDWSLSNKFFVKFTPINANPQGVTRVFFGKLQATAFGLIAEKNFISLNIENQTVVSFSVCKSGVLETTAVTTASILTPQVYLFDCLNGTISLYSNGVLLGTTSNGPNEKSIGTISYELNNGADAVRYRNFVFSSSEAY